MPAGAESPAAPGSLSAPDLAALRAAVDAATYADEAALAPRLVAAAGLDAAARAAVAARAAELVRAIRAAGRPGLIEAVLAEYGLSSDEGVALMCLAEALLRVPDAATMDALIEDKIAAADWSRHLGQSSSPLVNASTWALFLTGRVLEDAPPGITGRLRAMLRRLGEPVIRAAVARAIRELGRQFVLGETIAAAMARAAEDEARGTAFSYDMLGEAARTAADAARYHAAYAGAIAALAPACRNGDVRRNPGISVKLSALHPRYEEAQADRVMAELVPRLRDLARAAATAGMGLNVDAEEADRLSLSLDVVAAVLADPQLAGWEGLGVVVQAYGPRAGAVIDWLEALARTHRTRLMVRLVKGAYWDSEIKLAQQKGLDAFPVFTRKALTDVAWIAHAARLFAAADRLYPQLATHNAHSAAAALHLARARAIAPEAWEFQRLHGMGERLHAILAEQEGSRHRVYAPVGAHRDLLAYLVRRLLENGANSSFVNRIVDARVPPEAVAACPFAALAAAAAAPAVPTGADLFRPRRNARGWDLAHRPTRAALEAARAPFREAAFEAAPILACPPEGGAHRAVANPADPDDSPGTVREATAAEVALAVAAAVPWGEQAGAEARAAALERAADLIEADHGALFALLAREAGKTLPDAVAELREAVDFLRYYAAGARALDGPPLGRVACISPWNFPLAIFTGQVAAALAAGNAVLAKPAEQTPLVAHRAVQLLHEAGVPETALQLLPGGGPEVGGRLVATPGIDGVLFTGGTDTARTIARTMAERLAPGAPLVAETGGLNAMVVDSTALPEQAVRDILASAFQSAGQRCSALRMLYLQEEVAPAVLEMLSGAMDELRPGDPWDYATDVGPLIDAPARGAVAAHVARAAGEGRLIRQLAAPAAGHFVGPALIRVRGIADLGGREVFGPVLHVATFRAADLDRVIAEVNATGYGLTFGLHSRIEARVQRLAERLRVGNLYVNRNQIGAVVGSQPFGGEGLSGTGPKAGGPHMLPRLVRRPAPAAEGWGTEPAMTTGDLARCLAAAPPAAPPPAPLSLPGPTGEMNRLHLVPRAPWLCLGPGAEAAAAQAAAVRALGGRAAAATGPVDPALLTRADGLAGALWWGDAVTGRALARALAGREGPILPLVTGMPDAAHAHHERHLCVDTTASGGNAALLAQAG
jgi:RHH-type proline utilization regulon transcriptional repressor/proline dehydrogenase/delta 1-pyrroline-5-carboxylate dehydrogenase